jgi:hypothetical protein
MKTIKFGLALALGSILSACGGGSSEPVAPIEKYLGTWSGCVAYAKPGNQTIFIKETISISRIDDTNGALTDLLQNEYSDDACTQQTLGGFSNGTFRITIGAPFELLGLLGNEATITPVVGAPSKLYVAATDTIFRLGAVHDSKGQPTDWSYPFYKQ